MKLREHVSALTIGAYFLAAAAAHAKLVLHLPLDSGSIAIPAGRASFVRGVVGDALAIRLPGEGMVVESSVAGMKRSHAAAMSCWFKAKRAPEAEFLIVDGGGCRLVLEQGTGRASFAARGVKGSLAGIAAANKAYGYSNLGDGRWHHVAGCYDGRALTVYVDGVMEEILDASGQIAAQDPRIILGKTTSLVDESTNAASCLIDDIRIYDEALDYEAISKLVNRKTRRAETVHAKRVDLHQDFLDKGVRPIQVHRGGGLALPEHTLETYRQTWAMGMIPEADIRTTKDHAIICMHDGDLKRVCPAAPAPWKTTPIEEMTQEWVKTFDVGTFRGRPGQKVPTLEEVFREMRGRPERMLELDYKQIELGRLASLIDKYGVKDQVVFVTRRHHLIRQWQRVCPGAMTMLWMGGTEYALGRMFEQLRRDEFAGISILQIILFPDTTADGFQPPISYLQLRQSQLEERGIALQVIPWKISDPAVFERLLSAGFRYFATDYPETALEAYNRVVEPELRGRSKERRLLQRGR